MSSKVAITVAIAVLGALVINTGGTEITIDIRLTLPYWVRIASILIAFTALVYWLSENIELPTWIENDDESN